MKNKPLKKISHYTNGLEFSRIELSCHGRIITTLGITATAMLGLITGVRRVTGRMPRFVAQYVDFFIAHGTH